MAEFKLGRIRFVWKDEWAPATSYYVDDVVRYGGNTYICVVGHTSDSNFYTDLDFVPTKWNAMTTGQEWKGDWTTDTFYKENDIVKYGGLLYLCSNSHTSASSDSLGLEDNQSDWDLFAEGFDWKGDWATTTRYKKNDIVKYGATTYVCNTGHTSDASTSNGLEADQSSWDYFNQGIEYQGAWSGSSVRYKINDVVKYGAGLWVCNAEHTSTALFSDYEANWDQLVEGVEFESDWSSATTYQPGDIVRYGGNQYVAKTVHSNSNPVTETADWDLFAEGIRFYSDWSASTAYKIGSVVRLNGYTYIATADAPIASITVTASSSSTNRFTTTSTSSLVVGMTISFSGTTFGNVMPGNKYYVKAISSGTEFTISNTSGGATFTPSNGSGSMTGAVAVMPPNTSYWQRLNSGIQWKGEWTDDFEYHLGDAVRYGANAYICVNDHHSEGDDGSTIGAQGGGIVNSRPDLDTSGTYWNILSIGNESSVLTTRGDLVYFGGAGPTRLPVGIEGQVLAVSANNEPEWVSLGVVENVYYVSPTGIDLPAPVHGRTLNKPWKTIRYACEQIEKGPKNANAKRLLEMNRSFIQRETTEWIQWQIANAGGSGIWDSFVYEDFKCERDVGLVVDALIHDISHGGNVKSRGCALAYVNALSDSPGTYTKLGDEGEQDVAAFAYMLSVVESVLNQEAPAVNYQSLNGDNSTRVVDQWFDATLEAESNVYTDIVSLVEIVTDAITAGDATDIPARTVENGVLYVKTGTYVETLPIIVPEGYCLLGDEVRSVHVGPSSGTTNLTDAAYSIGALGRLEDVVADIVTGTGVSATSGNSEIQDNEAPVGDTAEETAVRQLVRVMATNIDYRLGTNALVSSTDPTGYNTSYLAGYGDARKLLVENKAFFAAEVVAYIAENYSSVKYSKTKCKRDVGYIIDALAYELTYGGDKQSIDVGLAYYDGATTTLMIDSTEKAATLATYGYLKDLVTAIAVDTSVTPLQDTVPQYRDTAGSAGAATFLGTNMDTIIDIIDNGVGAAPSATNPSTSWVGAGLTTAASTLASAAATIVSDTTAYIAANYPDLVYDSAKCERDVGYILAALRYDFMFASNFQTTKAAHAYLRASASDVYDLGQKTATRAAFEFVRGEAKDNVGGNAVAQARIDTLMNTLDDVIYMGSTEGSVCATEERNRDYAVLQLERNRDFIVAEIDAWIADTYSDTATATSSTGNLITISSTDWLQRNTAVRFTGTAFGDLSTGTTYYVQKIVSSTTFTVALTRNASDSAQVVLTTATGTMGVEMYYNSALCLRDVGTMIDALKFDLKYPGNYKSIMAARYYANSVTGSLEEDMFYVRDATGIRNMTMEGLTGDLLAPNEFGTSRVSAGAYVSLDPGWGPDDFRTWILSRSPYVQNCCTFGYAAIGQKIDGALHTGGNDSIVSNDFTQLISDGIGCWVTNNGRAELVSVFTYYSHVGYLAENGGRIRGTNGNNSYGDFGSVAEGFDDTETPNTGVVDNRGSFDATVGSVLTSGNQVYALEFDNAGSEYTEASWIISGAGTGVASVQDEFRDDGVFQVRLLETASEGDGVFGGEGYLSNANTAQGGTTTQITIAAVDQEISTAYVGMKIYLTAGTGVGQYGIIDTYNAGTKLATVVKESTGAAGWDHVVPGTTIVSPDASTTYVIEPRVSFTAPSFSSTAATLPSSSTWVDAAWAATVETYLDVASTSSGDGTGATFDVTRKGTKYTVVLKTGGTGYERLEELTIDGADVGGASTTNDITITATTVNSVSGEITVVDYEGVGVGGNFVALSTGGTATGISVDGQTWIAGGALPSSSLWIGAASGKITGTTTAGDFVIGRSYTILTIGSTDYESLGATSNTVGVTFVATGVGTGTGTATPNASAVVTVASGGTDTAYSLDGGVTWTGGGALPTTATWSSIGYGDGRWMVISSGGVDTAYSDDGGVTWSAGGDLPSSTTWTDIIYGQGKWVAVASGGTDAASSADDGASWTARTLPSSSNWTSVAYGNNRFVAVSNTSGTVAAYSLNGTTWTAATLPATANWTGIRYGQGVFMAVSQSTQAATSEDGIVWTSRTMSTAANGYSIAVFGNPNWEGTWVAVQRSTAGTVASYTYAGARARARAFVSQEKIFAVRILEPGSGYSSAPTMTITDPNNIYEAPFTVRIGKGALANPTYTNRGTSYVSASAEMDGANSNGYADFFQSGQYVSMKWLTQRPVSGSNVVFGHLPDRTFKLVNVLTFLGTEDGSYRAFFQISPDLTVAEAPDNGEDVTTRIRYSQVRLTGHDFLDIGTGNFTESNYPNAPLQDPIPANETVEEGGGRVFYTSTDQDGNFRVGDLFTIEQSTGVATLNADAFNIAGLQELTLGEVSLGGGSASINEFSTDPFFTADSDSVVPTQRAIKAYISSQIGGGGASLNVNSVTAGSIFIGTNQITTTTGSLIEMRGKFNFQGAVTGYPLAWNYFLT